MLNQITIMGRLTRDPELRYTQAQMPVASFTLAVDRDFGGRNGSEKQTDFIDCVAWRQTAEFVSKYFTKGRMAVVSGRLQSRKWQDKDGNNRTNWEVVVDNIYFGDARRDGDNSGDNRQTYQPGYSGNPSYGGGSSFSGANRNAPTPRNDDGWTEMSDGDDELPF